jgi:hypothetical protein
MRATQRLLLQVLALCICPLLTAQEPVELTPGPFDFTPLVSYRSQMNLTSESAVPGRSSRVLLDASPAYGFAFGVHIREPDVIEIRWSTQHSNVKIQDSSLGFAQAQMILNQFRCDFNHEYLLKHFALRPTPFIVASIGATHMSNGVDFGSTHFSVGMGGGFKFFLSQHLGFRIQAEWFPTLVGTQGITACGGACIVHLGGKLSSQGEVAIGPVLRFWKRTNQR